MATPWRGRVRQSHQGRAREEGGAGTSYLLSGLARLWCGFAYAVSQCSETLEFSGISSGLIIWGAVQDQCSLHGLPTIGLEF